jgi:adenosylhomocysteine nucleosidase
LTAPLGFVVGLAAEARIARSLGLVAVGGGLPAGAERAAEALVAAGAQGLISFGLAGGLDPTFRPGDIIIPAMVRAGDVDYPTSDLVGAAAGLLLAGTTIIATKAAKQALFQATSAAAIDLESGAVAQVAQRYNLPFAVLRAICRQRRCPRSTTTARSGCGGWSPPSPPIPVKSPT